MARRTTVALIDDLDGSPADETVEFALDGTAYEIDLSTAHADGLRDALSAYIDRARRRGRGSRSARPAAPSARPVGHGDSSARPHRSAAPGPTTTAPAPAPTPATVGPDGLTAEERERIRAWALEEGIEVKARGRLTKDLISNYRALQARR